MPVYVSIPTASSTDMDRASDRAAACVDVVAAMIEANRIIYRDKAKVMPIMVAATQKPREAVEYAWDVLTKNCVWSVNEGFEPQAHPVDDRLRRLRRRHRRGEEARPSIRWWT